MEDSVNSLAVLVGGKLTRNKKKKDRNVEEDFCNVDLSNYAMKHIWSYKTIVSLNNIETNKIVQYNPKNMEELGRYFFVTGMQRMFYGCNNLKSIPVLKYDMSQVTDLSWMFGYCKSLESLDLSGFTTEKVKDMSGMFAFCKSLKEIIFYKKNFKTNNVTSMNSMFRSTGLEGYLDLDWFDTSKVTDMESMFAYSNNITSLNIKSWNTANVTDFTDAFKFCTSLKEIDGVIDMRSCKKYKDMFLGCNKLRHLKIRNAPKYFANRCGLMINHIEFVD